jgi:perosamine synthetase
MTPSRTQRVVDLISAAIGTLLLLPVFGVVGLLVKIHDGGPVFYRAKRVGRGGKPFNLLKFRTMIADADKRGPALTARGDSRITPIGRVLRKIKLDELPQLLNVLKGDMSLVGPRPEDPRFVELYTPEQRKVLECRPGITSSVSLYLKNEESLLTGDDWVKDYCERILPHKLKTELAYIRQRTILSDVTVILRTILSLAILNKNFFGMILSLRNRHFLAIDILFALVAPAIGLVVRLDGFSDFGTYFQPLVIYTLSALLVKLAIFYPARFYDRYWWYAGIHDEEVLAVAGIATWGALIGVFFGILEPVGLIPLSFPHSIPFIDGTLTVFQVGAVRFLSRLSFERNEQLQTVTLKKQVAIVGAGSAGAMIAREMRANPYLNMEPTGFFDDDAYKQGMRIHGVKVLGTIAEIPKVVEHDSFEEVIIALPRASAEVVRNVALMCETLGIATRTIPGVFEILEGAARVSDIPDVDMADLLRRDGAETKAADPLAIIDGIRKRENRNILPGTKSAGASRKFLPYALPDLDNLELAEMKQALESGWVTTGPKTRQLEADFAAAVGAKHGIAVNSCTAALHLALEAVGVKSGDEVITTPFTFAATAEVIRYFNARPVFVDIDVNSLNLRPDLIKQAITPKTKAIIPVHIAGLSADMAPIIAIAAEHGIRVVEDAAHAFPSGYDGQLVGSMSDLTCFSFYATKTMTTGEGGMICTNNDTYAGRCKIMSLHGISNDAWKRYTAEGSWYYEIVAPGYKYNMTDVAAAMGLVQLRKADRMWRRRKEIAGRYNEAFAQLPELQIPHDDPRHQHAWQLYTLRLHLDKLAIDRSEFVEELKQRNIGASVHFIPLHIHPYYKDLYGYNPMDFPVAYMEYLREVSLPLYSKMTDQDVQDVIDAVVDIVQRNNVGLGKTRTEMKGGTERGLPKSA